jgi:hypothetical protein
LAVPVKNQRLRVVHAPTPHGPNVAWPRPAHT